MSAAGTGPRLTAQQAAALDVSGASVALSAGAGCGKTTVLAERFLRAVGGPDPLPLGRVVALTFTNKAARELRDRIRKECRARLEAGLGDPGRWRTILRGLEAARIGTFHAFCGEILRGHAIAAGVDPGFAVLDEPIAHALRDEALNQALRERLATRDPDLIELAVELGLGIVVQALDELLSNRSAGDLPMWAGRDPEDVLRDWVATWESTVRPAMIAGFVARSRPCRDLLGASDLNHPKVVDRVARLEDAFDRLATRGDDPASALGEIREHAKIQGLTAKGCWPSDDLKATVGEQFKSIRDDVDRLLESFEWDEATSRIAARQGVLFARLVLHARDAYDRAKARRGGLDNDDLLLKTRTLLAEHADTVCTDLSGSIDLMLVDEFQDTDPIQGAILRDLAGPGMAGGRLFLVGDFKQSIYRFRGARPELFHGYREAFPGEGRRSLTENFRSVPGILDFVNALFADTFDGPDVALVPGGGRPVGGQDEPAVAFLWDDAPPEPNGGEKADALARRRSEARRIAGYLKARLDAGWTVRDRKAGSPRHASAADVAILFRSLADASAYEAALAEAGLDYHVVGGSGFFAQQEVSDVINLLTAVEDPLDAVAMAGALRSPAFSVSDDALFWLVQETPGAPHAGLARAEGAWLDRVPEADRARLGRARRLLHEWRAIKDRVSIAVLVDRVLDESGYEAALLGESLGDRKRANARKLVRMARVFDEEGGFTLADFVARLRADLRAATKENQAATTDEDGEIVRLMSIHQAKGLEFPIVVVPDLDRKRPGDLKRVAFDGTLGPLVNPVADPGDGEGEEPGGSLGWTLHRFLERQADDAEALRLLYVATTRARDFLLLSAAGDPARPPTSPALALLDRRFDRATGRFKGCLPDGLVEPRVVVLGADRPGQSPHATAPRPRPRLLDVAREIREALARAPSPSPAAPARARPPAIDLDPAWGLPSRGVRLDRLVRTILADPKAHDPGQLPHVASRAARLQDPVANPSLVAEALEFLADPAWRKLASDLARVRRADRAFPWSIAWTFEGSPIVLAGVGDFALDRADGATTVIQVSSPGACPARERLRLLVSAHVAQQRRGGDAPLSRWIALGTPGRVLDSGRTDPDAIDDAVRAVLDGGQGVAGA